MFYKTTGSVTVYVVLTCEYVNQEYIKNKTKQKKEYIDQSNRTGHTEIEQKFI